MAKCMYCSEPHERKGKYCSDSCKQRAYRRNATVTDNAQSVTVADAVTVEPVTVTGTVKGGICWCCGADIHMALVCCGHCAWFGKSKAKRAGREPLSIGQPAWEDAYVY